MNVPVRSSMRWFLCLGLVMEGLLLLPITGAESAGTISKNNTHHHAHKPAHKVVHGHAAQKRPPTTISGHKRTSATAHHHVVKAVPATTPTQESSPATPAQPVATIVDKGSETGLPLPRFAALRADRVYMRRGPGERYPIDWVYHRRGLPMKIEREFGVWRLVEDSEGQKGWVHQVTLKGSRTFVIPGDVSTVGTSSTEQQSQDDEKGTLPAGEHADPRIIGYLSSQVLPAHSGNDAWLMSSAMPDHKLIAVLKPGTVGRVLACKSGSAWCHVVVRGYDGWLERRTLWGVQPDESLPPG